MEMKVLCPNGHKLRVDRKHAGHKGMCPRCQSRFVVPFAIRTSESYTSESSIVALLGGIDTKKSVVSSDFQTSPQATRVCTKCQREMSIKYHICPHCRTYQPMEAARREVRANCPHCGTASMPGDASCRVCSADLHCP